MTASERGCVLLGEKTGPGKKDDVHAPRRDGRRCRSTWMALVLSAASVFVLAQQAGPSPATRAAMEASLNTALHLLEMDTAAWAATDQAAPTLEKIGKKVQKKAEQGGYVQWKDGDVWHVLFFYATADARYPLAEVALAPPLTRQSRGELKEFKPGKTPALDGRADVLVRASLVAKKKFEYMIGAPSKPFFNQYLFSDEQGLFRAFFVPGDLSNYKTLLGPDAEILIDPESITVRGARQFHKKMQIIALKAGAGGISEGEKDLYLEEPLPGPTDFLKLLLHPEIGSVTAVTPQGRFRMRAGRLPSFLPWLVPGGGRDPGEDDMGAWKMEAGAEKAK